MTTTATADFNDLASRIAQTLRETSETSTNGLRDDEGEPRPEATDRGIFMPWRPFGRILILTGEWLRTIGGPGPTVPLSPTGGEAKKFNWLGLLGVIFVAVGQWLQTQ